MKSKLELLVESSVVGLDTEIRNLVRLVSGDLAHIGDAITSGKEIEITTYGDAWKVTQNLRFSGVADNYRVKKETININGFDVPKPLALGDIAFDEKYWFVDFKHDSGVDSYLFENDSYDKRIIERGVSHKTEEDALLHAKALLSFTQTNEQEK